jgi:NAD/NADP transhydrogenase beta subunit
MGVATISIGLPIRIIAALNHINFRGDVHWTTWVIEFVSIMLCYVIAWQLETRDRALAIVTRISALIGIILCALIGGAPMPFSLW